LELINLFFDIKKMELYNKYKTKKMRKYHSVRKCGSGRRRHMRGAGLLDWMKRAGSFIKSNKLVSRGLNALSGVVGPQYSGLAKTASGVASSLGYGRRRVRGGALSLAGGSLGGAMRRLRLR
jgi:hypothetical protein